ncbi:hypothetical protein B0187_04870 [Haemophilus paracuniculus]|uniref:Uncharacterized protein n=1 Tax=Haemophilus paracuniculus TaxID=734 RepID=A0A1T0ASM6_9PAST|nr:hypothetical protein B0187_04870 [Haemophilus paracuniculus]
MLRFLKRPLNADSLEAWCKMLDDVAKVALLTTPVVIYSNNGLSYKIANGIFLAVAIYACIIGADALRRNKGYLTHNEMR